MHDAASWVLSDHPDVLVVVSPHTPRMRHSFGVVASQRISGNFGNFGVPSVKLDLPGGMAFMDALMSEAHAGKEPLVVLPDRELDHGAMVPLHFSCLNGWSGPTVILSFPSSPAVMDCVRMGELIRKTAERRGLKCGLIAYGDMSHRLSHSAPGGFHPEAAHFDEVLCRIVRQGDWPSLLSMTPEFQRLRAAAGEDMVDSLLVAVGAGAARLHQRQLLSYGPFGSDIVAVWIHPVCCPSRGSLWRNTRPVMHGP
jgi:aromatic ring-opening dioxygenase LigB subunit